MATAKVKTEASIYALSKVQQRYAERGDLNSRGDWMAEALKVFRTRRSELDLVAFNDCLSKLV